MYDCKAPLSRFYYPDTRRIINAFIIIIYNNVTVSGVGAYMIIQSKTCSHKRQGR